VAQSSLLEVGDPSRGNIGGLLGIDENIGLQSPCWWCTARQPSRWAFVLGWMVSARGRRRNHSPGKRIWPGAVRRAEYSCPLCLRRCCHWDRRGLWLLGSNTPVVEYGSGRVASM
jgi:hypothetical protein